MRDLRQLSDSKRTNAFWAAETPRAIIVVLSFQLGNGCEHCSYKCLPASDHILQEVEPSRLLSYQSPDSCR